MKFIASTLVVILSSFAFGSNGTHSTGASAAASAMGGTSQGNYTSETEALFRNPALLSNNTKEVMKPKVEVTAAFVKHNSQGSSVNGSTTLPAYVGSADNVHVLPNLAAGMRITEELAAGLGIVSVGGSTIDYTGNNMMSEQKGEQFTYRITPALSYRIVDTLQFGAGLNIGYSSLQINNSVPLAALAQSKTETKSAWGVGGIFGLSFMPVPDLRLGTSFVTKSKFTFKGVYDLSILGGTPSGTLNDINFQEPSEYAIGGSYTIGNLLLALDYRWIMWSSADGYSHLGWNDQNVFHLGAQYKMDNLSIRGGIVWAKSPIRETTGINGDVTSDFQGVTVLNGLVAQSNVGGFTGINEWEFDVGAGYQFTEMFSADLAIVYCPTTTITQSGTLNSVAAGGFATSSKANEWAIIAGLNVQL